MKLRVLDLFSGIGGFSLGLERTGGFETVAFCEIEPYPRAVLAKHWPGVPIYDDVRTLTADALRRDGIAVDVICGGFPCQDLSFAGKRAGLEGARSGLWGEYARIIGELRPRFVIVENVPGLLSLGMGTVLGDLAALGYDATWDCIPASAVGAHHRRDRVWLIAHTKHHGPSRSEVAGSLRAGEDGGRVQQSQGLGAVQVSPDADRQGQHDGPVDAEMGRAPQPLADATSDGRKSRWARNAEKESRRREPRGSGEQQNSLAHSKLSGCEWRDKNWRRAGAALPSSWWVSEPDVGRVAHGIPSRVDRLKGLGNAVVPQIPELIGRAILAAERAAA